MVFCVEVRVGESVCVTVHVACHLYVCSHGIQTCRTCHDVVCCILASAVSLNKPSAECLSVSNDNAVVVSKSCDWRILLHLLCSLKHATVCIIIGKSIVWFEGNCKFICQSLVAGSHHSCYQRALVVHLIIFYRLDFSIVRCAEHYGVSVLVHHLLLLGDFNRGSHVTVVVLRADVGSLVILSVHGYLAESRSLRQIHESVDCKFQQISVLVCRYILETQLTVCLVYVYVNITSLCRVCHAAGYYNPVCIAISLGKQLPSAVSACCSMTEMHLCN